MVCASLLAKEGFEVKVIEKGEFPSHKVCGEYVSNEVTPFLKQHNLYPDEWDLPLIHRFQLTSVSGASANASLKMGGFGISRFRLDDFLYKKALTNGAAVLPNTQVNNIEFQDDQFYLQLNNGNTIITKWVIGAHGKRSVIDKKLNRPFISERSDFLGVKYHIKTDLPADTIALHNFEGGYCGVSQVEQGEYNLCYLGTRSILRQYGDIATMEEQILMKNPFLRDLFTNSDFLFDKPLVINEISFRKKLPVEDHIFMAGDAAGLITPLCGNGMALAIHSAKILSDVLIQNINHNLDRSIIEQQYIKRWNKHFSTRLLIGRVIQNHLFGSARTSNVAINLLKLTPPFARWIIKQTHGDEF